ncbi:TetR/AcrR family transcriptional regulator [Pararhizobium sp. IMCC21322]|uniref:TetR/AcrR family transcriptional regulator n=1 Tax=Pararhizobium sp. IMCC21322 TaxID=3067903 RepID=UPI00274117D1|nr:TetR/AcrR family transcriptional regulator [Pararhizobium sp. IMCC21322]
MPRVSAAEKERSHNRIIEEASRLLRSGGLETTSVSDVMNSAGLTHGGFYRHFKSKDELVGAAFHFATQDVTRAMRAAETQAERLKALDNYISTYLSVEHVDDLSNGCPLAALSGEAARTDGAARQSASEALKTTTQLIANAIGGAESVAMSKANTIACLLVGTISLARIAVSNADRDQLLKDAKEAIGGLLG